MAETFAELLRALRLAGGYSRRGLAEGAAISEGAVRDYEQGKRSPSLEAAARLAFALGISLARLSDCAGLLEGAFRLPPRPARADALTFGKYQGRLPEEVPTDYLEWLAREKPKPLSPAQLETVRRLLRERGQDRAQGQEEEQRAVEAVRQAEARLSRARRNRGQEIRLEEAIARRAAEEARLAEAETNRLLAEEARLARRREVLQAPSSPPIPAPTKPAKGPILDDSLPWEQGDDTPPA